ncbi:MAG: response regulator [Acidobacteriota bacterium]
MAGSPSWRSNPAPTGEGPDRAPILVVDDLPMNLDAIDALLVESECRVVRAHSADQALLAVLEQDFAAIVLDIKMPGMSGIELADLIKTRPRSRHTPILFLTAHMFNEGEILRGYGAGAVDYLTKPVHADILRSKIAVFVELFRKTRELARMNDVLRREVAERERAEEALRVVNQELEERVLERTTALQQADRRKDEFLAVLGHELRNPLAPILSAIELLDGQQAPPTAQEKARGVIRRQIRQMTRLIDDLLDVGRITSDRLVLRPSTVELAAVVDAAIETCRPAMDARGHRLDIGLPAEPVLLRVDAARLSQVLSNLLSNAIKYTAPAGGISVIASGGRTGLDIRVRDTGAGIDASVLPTIFELFVQVEQRDGSTTGGLGIGLALARQLVEMHGGTIRAASEGLGRGSEFSIWLPPGVLAQDATAALDESRVTGNGAGLRVLVVDDNDDAADMLTYMLTSWGHVARPAYDGVSALDAAEVFRPDVVLLDLGLPGLDGYAVAERLRARPWAATVPIFAVTGRGQDEDRARTRAAGFQGHFVKPVVPETLRDALEKAVNV